MFLKDTPYLNVLDADYEVTDDELLEYVKAALIEINMDFTPTTYWIIDDVVSEPGQNGQISWTLVKLGATLEYLTSNGILSARNTLTYNDAGGVQVSDMDKWGRYVNYYNVLISKYMNGVTGAKRAWNIGQLMGTSGVRSPMDTMTW